MTIRYYKDHTDEVERKVAEAYAAGFEAGAEARDNQVRQEIIGVMLRHLSDVQTDTLLVEFSKAIRALPMPVQIFFAVLVAVTIVGAGIIVFVLAELEADEFWRNLK